MKFIDALIDDINGATAIEYGLIVAFIAIGLITAMQSMGNQLAATFNTTSSAIAGANAA